MLPCSRWPWLLGLLAATSAVAAPADDKLVVAVMYFDNNTNQRDYDVLQKGLADMLVTDLSEVDSLQVVEREKMEALLSELKLQRSKFFDPKTAQKLGKGIGARYAITGSLAAFDPQMRIDIRLIDVPTAKVVMADKVVGPKEKFFELQQQLVAKFVTGLNVRGTAGGELRSGVTDVRTLLKYSQGLDSADKGDLQGASSKLAEVVRDSPDFTLAKEKYGEIIRRLREAAKKRVGALQGDEAALVAKIDEVLKEDLAALDPRAAGRYLSYRVARGNYLLSKMLKLEAVEPQGLGVAFVSKEQRSQLLQLQKQYFENVITFIEEMKVERAKGKPRRNWSPDFRLDNEDRERGKALDIGSDFGKWSFADPAGVAIALGSFAFKGQHPFWSPSEVRGTLRPSLVESEPSYQKRVFALLKDARKDLETHQDPADLPNSLADLTDAHAEALVQLGRKEEAIAQWQGYLDAFPKSTKFQAFEQKIEDLLGISDKSTEAQKKLKACRIDAMALLFEETVRLGRSDGTNGVRKLIKQVEKDCGHGQMGPGWMNSSYQFAARDAVLRGDCAFYRELHQAAVALMPVAGDLVGNLGGPCR